MDKIVYHIKDKKNLCGASSDNAIIGSDKTLEDIKEIINNNTKHIKLCKRCKRIMENKK